MNGYRKLGLGPVSKDMIWVPYGKVLVSYGKTLFVNALVVDGVRLAAESAGGGDRLLREEEGCEKEEFGEKREN